MKKKEILNAEYYFMGRIGRDVDGLILNRFYDCDKELTLFDFGNGLPIKINGEKISATVFQDGPFYGVTFGSLPYPCVSQSIYEFMCHNFDIKNIQFIKVQANNQLLYYLNPLNIFDCINFTSSKYEAAIDYRTLQVKKQSVDLFHKAVFYSEKISGDFFLANGYPLEMVISRKVKNYFDSIGIREFNYQPIFYE